MPYKQVCLPPPSQLHLKPCLPRTKTNPPHTHTQYSHSSCLTQSRRGRRRSRRANRRRELAFHSIAAENSAWEGSTTWPDKVGHVNLPCRQLFQCFRSSALPRAPENTTAFYLTVYSSDLTCYTWVLMFSLQYETINTSRNHVLNSYKHIRERALKRIYILLQNLSLISITKGWNN